MPIVQTLWDTDFYKITMAQMIWRKYRDIPVKFELINRTKDYYLSDVIPEEHLRSELDLARELRFSEDGLEYLRKMKVYEKPMFCEEFLEYLSSVRLPPCHLERRGGQYHIEFSGPWQDATHWEIPGLAIVNELKTLGILARPELSVFAKDVVFASGKMRLWEKIQLLRQYPDITFTDFGTRRRFSRVWQEYIVKTCKEELPGQFIGTSNVWLSMKYGMEPKGTCAHEPFMGVAAMFRAMGNSIQCAQTRVLGDWWNEYGEGLSIVLPDTFGSNSMFQIMTRKQARDWKGFRHDSADPIEFGEKVIRFYERHRVDPRQKLIVFSDGLDVYEIIRIADHFRGRIRVTFGWGTNLTNDFLFSRPISLVIKLTEAAGHGTVKLSDNLAKATGRTEDIEQYKRELGYTNETYEPVKY